MKEHSLRKSRDMRVLMIVPTDGPHDKPSSWAVSQIASLEQVGIEISVYEFQNRRSVRGLIAGGLAFRRKALEFEADIVHVHYGAAQALAAVLFSPKPLVISFCGSDLFGNYDASGKKTWLGFLSMILSQIAALGCTKSIAKTTELRRALWFPWSRQNCSVIPNGVDLQQFHPIPQEEARAALGWEHQEPVVLFVDQWNDWVKDPSLAKAAYDVARHMLPSVRWYRAQNERPKKMPLFYNAADVLLLTSRHEGSNNAVKEALACNLPIVATPCGDTVERLQNVNACYVCRRDAQDLGLRLSHVLTQRNRTDGYEHMLEFSLKPVAMRIRRCYEEVLLQRASRWSLIAWRQRMHSTTRRDLI